MADAFVTRDTLISRHEPWLTTDLVSYLEAISVMFAELEALTYDSAEREGWVVVYVPDEAPLQALPYLAQFVGQPLPLGGAEADQRTLIASRAHMRRGTPQAIKDAVAPYLTGAHTVLLTERYQGVADQLLVTVYSGEVADQAVLQSVLRGVVPADVRLTFAVSAGQVWQTLLSSNASWNAVATRYPSWDQARLAIVP